jgi:hypothetical protein
MAWSRLVFEQIKAFLLDQLKEDGGSERAKLEVKKWCNIVAKALLLFDGFLPLVRTDRKDLRQKPPYFMVEPFRRPTCRRLLRLQYKFVINSQMSLN